MEDALTPEGNITDRSFSWSLARAKHGRVDDESLGKRAAEIRRMFNPGQPGHYPFPTNLPSYVEVLRCLADLGMLPSFTAQLRGRTLESMMAPLRQWGIRALDTAGIEPDEPNAQGHIQHMIRLAEEHDMALFGGSDYRGSGTGWTEIQPWMAHPRIVESLGMVAYKWE